MKLLKLLLAAGALIVVLVVGFRFMAGWLISGAFESASQSGDLSRLADALQATAGSTIARGDLRLPGAATGQGALAFYSKNPQALQRDKRFFETWHSALSIADIVRKEHGLSEWESSIEAKWIPPQHKKDAWGHPFCIESDQQGTIVVSPGPEALSSLDCNTLKISEKQLEGMPEGRLIRHPSGALILFINKYAPNRSADVPLLRPG